MTERHSEDSDCSGGRDGSDSEEMRSTTGVDKVDPSSNRNDSPISNTSSLTHIPPGPCTLSWSHSSSVPITAESESDPPSCVLGVDEAGRGPVLGPMVYAVSYTPSTHKEKLKDIGFADSKVLSESQRDELFARIEKESSWIGWAVTVCSPQDISESMLRRTKYNLNALAHDTTINLIQSVLDQGVNVQEVFVDTVGPAETYQAKLQKRFPQIGKIVVSKKADSLFPIVSAASICAKVTRDAILKNWEFVETGIDSTQRGFGSGYPSDPKTTAWLRNHLDPVFGFPRIVRFSWSTTAKLLETHGVSVLWKHEQEETDSYKLSMSKRLRYEDIDFGVGVYVEGLEGEA
ncbi:ribonuclease HII [Batrachochytrium salamandrivorans]|nr:ribonuclease HII [Batrachochytrium salamandrivorans]